MGGEGWAGPQERSNFQEVNDRRSSSQLHIMGGLEWVGGPNYQGLFMSRMDFTFPSVDI